MANQLELLRFLSDSLFMISDKARLPSRCCRLPATARDTFGRLKLVSPLGPEVGHACRAGTVANCFSYQTQSNEDDQY